jgi:hypothetical protein
MTKQSGYRYLSSALLSAEERFQKVVCDVALYDSALSALQYVGTYRCGTR